MRVLYSVLGLICENRIRVFIHADFRFQGVWHEYVYSIHFWGPRENVYSYSTRWVWERLRWRSGRGPVPECENEEELRRACLR